MSASSFIEYASSGNLDPDETYTVELLIERVWSDFEPENYWAEWSERSDARKAPGYQPSLSMSHVVPAAAELKKLSWLSFQRLREDERPVRNLTALRYLEGLTGLVLINNTVTDLTPLQHCKKLRRLILNQNPIRDISPLSALEDLEDLEATDTQIEDFSVLERLPKLAALSISVDQSPAFRRLQILPSVRKLNVDLGPFDSFVGFPQMPELRAIRSAHVTSLNGLERFPKLENLVNFSGPFDSFEPLRDLKHLTHANFYRSRVASLEPLSRLVALRELWLSTEVPALDLSPLEGLPSQHNVTIQFFDPAPPSLAKLRAELSSWDVEFRSEKPRHTPSLDIQVVDQPTFNHYDSEKPYGLKASDTNERLLSCELEWLDEQLHEVFAVDFVDDEDYTIPHPWAGARSRTVVLLSERAVEAFPRLVLGIQNVLSTANNDWIIYFQSAEPDDNGSFIVWVYPDKILVTEKYAANVQRLVEPR